MSEVIVFAPPISVASGSKSGWLSAARWISEYRIYFVLAAVFLLMAAIAPHFLTARNLTAILTSMSVAMPAAIGFTIVTICGQLDLSVGTSLTLGAMLAIGLQQSLGWCGSIPVALFCGGAVGLFNGLLVSRLKVDSFIATLGTMAITQGLVFIYCHGGTLNLAESPLSRWMESPVLWLLTPRVLITLLLVFTFDVILKYRREGRQLFLIGGSVSTAKNVGVNVDACLIWAFVLSGVLAASGGVLLGVGLSTATASMGNSSLMQVVAAVIIGGTAMTGGKGSVLQTLLAMVALAMLYNGLECMVASSQSRKIASGALMAGVVLYDADATARLLKVRGRRQELMEEVPRLMAEDFTGAGSEIMQRRDSIVVAIAAMGITGCVAIVAVFAMYFTTMQREHALPAAAITAVGANDLHSQEMADDAVLAALKSGDGQPLILPSASKSIQARPANPDALSQDDSGHWYDMEYAGWGIPKVNPPKSFGDGPRGKRVTYLQPVDHPYQTALVTGMTKVAKVYGMQLTVKVADNDVNQQAEQIDEAINDKPDMVICSPVDAKACVPMFRKLNEAGIPVIAVNLLPATEAHQYLLAFTGPDDWQQFRLLARELATRMHNTGNYCIVQHRPGSSPFFSRTWSVVTELKKIAPQMKCLAMQTTDLDSEKTKDVVSGWITRFGPDLKGIVSPDDSGTQVGINEAIKNANRQDIVRVSAGNSKVGMDFVQAGELDAITYQSPEADGAIPMKLAADWFYGRPIEPIRYLPIAIITKQNVAKYEPAQW